MLEWFIIILLVLLELVELAVIYWLVDSMLQLERFE